MAWVRFKKLAAFPEGVHRVGRSQQEIIFRDSVEHGLVDVRHRDDVQMLLRLPDYEIALERYGITYDAQGWEQEPSGPRVVTSPPQQPMSRRPKR